MYVELSVHGGLELLLGVIGAIMDIWQLPTFLYSQAFYILLLGVNLEPFLYNVDNWGAWADNC